MESEEFYILKQLEAWGIELVLYKNEIIYIHEEDNNTNENSNLNKSIFPSQKNNT